jgi:hypothetical protein
MSKEFFEIMQQENLAQLYPYNFTKKEASKTGADLTKKVFDEGNIDPVLFASNLARLGAVIESAMAEFRRRIDLFEKITINGVEFNPINGGEILNYKEDSVYSEIFDKLKAREELLKLAHKSNGEIYDHDGIMIPKVSSSPRKSSITIKF